MIKEERKEWDKEERIKKKPLKSRHDKRRKKRNGTKKEESKVT